MADDTQQEKKSSSLLKKLFAIVASLLVATAGVAAAVDNAQHHSSDSNHGDSPTLGDNASKLPTRIGGKQMLGGTQKIIWDSIGDPSLEGIKKTEGSANIAADKPAVSFNDTVNPQSRIVDLDPEGTPRKNYYELKPHTDYFKTHSDLENGDGKDYANNTSLKERLNGEYYSLDEHGNSISVSDEFDPTVDPGSGNYFSSHVIVKAGSSLGHGNSLGANITTGPNFHVGNNTTIYADVKFGKDVHLGSDVVVGPGSIIKDGSSIDDGTNLQSADIGTNVHIGKKNLIWQLKASGNNTIGSENLDWPDDSYNTNITMADGAAMGDKNALTHDLSMWRGSKLGSYNVVNPNVTILGDAGSNKTLGDTTVPAGLGVPTQKPQPGRPNAQVVSSPAPLLTQG